MMQPLGSSSRAGTARPGRLWWYNKKTEFYAFLSLLWVKSISAFLVFDRTAAPIWHRQTTKSGKHLIQFDRLPRGETPDGARWPCSFTLTVFQPGEGAPASLSTYTIEKKWKKCRDLRTGPTEISEFWHADSFARIMKKSFSQDLDWITP